MSYRPCKKLYLTSKLGEGSSILPTNHSVDMQTITNYVDLFVDRLFCSIIFIAYQFLQLHLNTLNLFSIPGM